MIASLPITKHVLSLLQCGHVLPFLVVKYVFLYSLQKDITSVMIKSKVETFRSSFFC